MTAQHPQSVVPAVAFEIPLERKDLRDSPPVQKRLINSPRKTFSLQDLVKKLTDASKRRENVISGTKSKTSAHNAVVKRVLESSATRDFETLIALENRITSKLDSADERRGGKTANLVQKLSETNKDKLERGNMALQKAEILSKEIQQKELLKEESAECRREQLMAQKVQELASLNDSKQRRGQLALELSEIDGKHNENQLDQKMLSATHRREMAIIFKSLHNSDSAAEKKEKVAEIRRKEEEASLNRAIAIEEKIKLAEERRRQKTAEAVTELSMKTNDKLRRGAESINGQIQRSKENEQELLKKVELANERRMKQLQEQQEAFDVTSLKQESRKEQLSLEEDARHALQAKHLHLKLSEASSKREEFLFNKSAKVAELDAKKKERAAAAKQMEWEEAAKLSEELERKMNTASARKHKIMRDVIQEMHEVNKGKAEKVEILFNKQELEEMQRYSEIEAKLAAAAAKRTEKLAEVLVKSSSKKRISSPRPSPTKGEIDARINKAAARREMILNHRVDKATASSSSKKITPRGDLFSKVTHRLESPRIKAAHLEDVHHTGGNQEVSDALHSQQFTMMPIIAASVMALALVGAMSLWKH